ncbi:cell division protein ZapE [Salana multivorans]|uniref:Cell division protein ZapE n=2 Tax=Salana multivorans TaxID=120377 RepID=A0A3N2D1I5_9MICO|nr:cell division protein ZapE [Salana multivorans]
MPARAHLTDRMPEVAPSELLAGLVPPPQFAGATFESYHPDPAHPSQAAALATMRGLAEAILAPPRRGLFRKAPPPPASVYLDGGYGVGKTHLLASLAHAVGPERSAYGTFVELTHLVGAMGFAQTVSALSALRLLCIDEFELDDPGDTVLMSRLLRELADAGVCIVATSNTLPEALGEGRFAAEDFMREIQALAARFTVVRIDGPDYRMRDGRPEHRTLTDEELAAELAAVGDDATVSQDAWGDLLAHLARIHPSRYGRLVDDVDAVFLTGAAQLDDDMVGLRLVVLVDRLYDRDVPVRVSGTAVADLFSPRMLSKGYRKKYFRALSRLGALASRRLP